MSVLHTTVRPNVRLNQVTRVKLCDMTKADDHNHVFNDNGHGQYVCWCGKVLGA